MVGPHKNPWFPKTLDDSIQDFKEFNFDVMFVSTLAPGMPAYNNVERRMAQVFFFLMTPLALIWIRREEQHL